MAEDVYSYRNNKAESVVIFIHGFTGNLKKTWGKFPEYLKENSDLSEWDIFSIGYPSSLFIPELIGWTRIPDIHTLAKTLTTRIETTFDRYKNIALVAHSMVY